MVGIDISDRSIKIAEVVGDEKPVIRTLCWSPLAEKLIRRGIVQDVSLVTEALQEAMKRCSPVALEGMDVVASIPEEQSFVRVLDVPDMSAQELDEAVQWAVRRHIPFDLDRVYLDWEVIKRESKKKSVRVLVGAVQRAVVDPLLAVLDDLALNVVALELEPQADVRCLLPRSEGEARDIRGVLIVDLGATLTNVVLFDQGAMRFTTSIPVGGDYLTERLAQELHINPREALEKKEDIGAALDAGDQLVANALRAATLDLAGRVQQSVGEISAQLAPDEEVQVILLSGGSANLSGIVELFGSVFKGIPVQLGNPWANVQKGSGIGVNLSSEDAMHFITAIGLALRPPKS